MEAEWRAIKGFPKYEVSNTGDVRSFVKFSSGKILRQSMRVNGYKFVGLITSKNNRKHLSVHRIVIENFKPEKISEGLQCNHINGVKTDNRIENLEWVTASENTRHAYRMGLIKRVEGVGCVGSKNHKSKLTESDVILIREMAKTASHRRIATKYNICHTTIDSIVNRITWKHI